MRENWIISDTHFFHENILNFRDSGGELIRGKRFANVREMNQCIMDNWNSLVKPGDNIYHLGDVVCGKYDHDQFRSFWSLLHGRKRLILGNHDNVKFLSPLFRSVRVIYRFQDHNIMLSHIPLDVSGLYDYKRKCYRVNVHGHIHQNDSPTDLHYNVSVEKTDYKPVNLDDLALKLEREMAY